VLAQIRGSDRKRATSDYDKEKLHRGVLAKLAGGDVAVIALVGRPRSKVQRSVRDRCRRRAERNPRCRSRRYRGWRGVGLIQGLGKILDGLKGANSGPRRRYSHRSPKALEGPSASDRRGTPVLMASCLWLARSRKRDLTFRLQRADRELWRTCSSSASSTLPKSCAQLHFRDRSIFNRWAADHAREAMVADKPSKTAAVPVAACPTGRHGRNDVSSIRCSEWERNPDRRFLKESLPRRAHVRNHEKGCPRGAFVFAISTFTHLLRIIAPSPNCTLRRKETSPMDHAPFTDANRLSALASPKPCCFSCAFAMPNGSLRRGNCTCWTFRHRGPAAFGGVDKWGWLHYGARVPAFLAIASSTSSSDARAGAGYLSLILLGVGTALTGYSPGLTGILILTLISSVGFQLYETVNQSLQLQMA